MVSKGIIVNNPQGLHARPATMLVQKATIFKSDVTLECNGKGANAKSLIGVLSLGVNQGYEIKIITKGSDEEYALKELVTLIENLK